jgi:glutathionyl-hydroquinone reductase
MNRRHAKETIKEDSSNVGGKMLSDRRRELYEIIKRAQTQRIEVVPILLEKMQERIISNNSKDMLIPSSRLNKAHRVGRLKFSGMLILKLCFRKTLAEI